jgi:NAD(P)-dependent dehydrogenase (short-subunit alcohol dehydrogenase family)
MAALFDLSGKVVLVTGGNSGLGFGFAKGCARQGADIIIWGRNRERNEASVAELSGLGPGSVTSDSVDVSDEDAVVKGVAQAVDKAGRIDCVFVNAGIVTRSPSFVEMTSDTYHSLLATNLHGAFYTLREVARHMVGRAIAGDRGGSIVVCGSLAIFAGRTGLQHYGAAKGALASMVKGLATELGPHGVRANMIVPGTIRTGMTLRHDIKAVEKRLASITPLGRIGEIEDIQGLAVYFASDASSFHTGDIVVLDGGRLANTP